MTRNWIARTTQNSGKGNGNVRWSGGTSSKMEGSKNGTVTAPSSPADPASTAAVFRSLTMLTSCGMCGSGVGHEATALPCRVAAVTRLPLLPQRPICQHLDIDTAHRGAGLKARLAAVVRPVPVGQGHATGRFVGKMVQRVDEGAEVLVR